MYNKTGYIMGKSFCDIHNICDEYIVFLDEFKQDGTKCVVMTESCLEKI